MDFDLDNKVVLVTGSSAGIGRTIALAFAREKARVAVTFCAHQAEGERTADQVRAEGGSPLLLHYDLANYESIRTCVQEVVQYWGGIDVLVANAVRWPPLGPATGNTLFEQVLPTSWLPTFENLTGTYRTVQAVLPTMRSRPWGRIVFLSSNLAQDGHPGAGAYAAAKAGLHGLSRVLARELAAAHILVNVVVPGMTLTERGKKLRPKELNERIAAITPTCRLTTPEDVANAVVFLGSAANGHINGEAIRVTGGL